MMSEMAAPVLDYAVPAATVRGRLYWAARAALTLAVVLAALAAVAKAGQLGVEEWQLRREAARLLVANRPAQSWPAPRWPAPLPLAVTPAGRVVLPDGRTARLAELAVPSNPATADWTPELGLAFRRLRPTRFGYTAAGTGRDGVPVVQLWALTPNAWGGMCGNSTRAERRRGGMLLWRNVGAFMVRNGMVEGKSTVNSPISVTGY